jgi:hypothetical protein
MRRVGQVQLTHIKIYLHEDQSTIIKTRTERIQSVVSETHRGHLEQLTKKSRNGSRKNQKRREQLTSALK